MKVLIVSCSLSSGSHSRAMASILLKGVQRAGAEVELVDLRDYPLPLCDGGPAYGDPNVRVLSEKITDVDAVALAVPVYNYDVGGAVRNLIAMTGKAWTNKVVAILGAAGGQRSHMALLPLANSLMLDFRCVIVPRFVYASSTSFDDACLRDEDIALRIDGLAGDLVRLSDALSG